MGSIRIESGDDYGNRPPKGTKIIKHNVNTVIEKISNGYIITKNHSGRYLTGKGKDDYSYFDYSEKQFSEENPVKVDIKDEVDFEEDSALAKDFPGLTKEKE